MLNRGFDRSKPEHISGSTRISVCKPDVVLALALAVFMCFKKKGNKREEKEVPCIFELHIHFFHKKVLCYMSVTVTLGHRFCTTIFPRGAHLSSQMT